MTSSSVLHLQKPILELQKRKSDLRIIKNEDWANLEKLNVLLHVLKEGSYNCAFVFIRVGTLELGKTSGTKISEYAIQFESIIKKVRDYGDKEDARELAASGGKLSSPFADAADLCCSKLINYYQFVDNPIVLVATVLDPRGKLIAYKMTDHEKKYTEQATEALEEAYNHYVSFEEIIINNLATPTSAREMPRNASSSKPSIFAKLKEVAVVQSPPQTELSRYLAQEIVDSDTDVLKWWKLHSKEFPTLSKMARDYLAIQCSSKDTEGAFSKGRRQMPYYRASLKGTHFKAQMLVNSGEALGMF